ncbi:hypothetical protein CONCODRAFT_83148 [Conidiobolus coronatus NRRL 28638]|uniref:Amino acid transporter transmembrane domain-containing protein n=1 Tax=Conidiobolus coronatus (strain ATCC 28846 / CBS 209.66 / NRRL 28638) TaxID=796925 RepID=A0A137PG95_CONC2|nr:hypothetical protein CONCODRAFT_83148 [Conidiobolus coronatus NRRL 28638]|eukprot:KXN74026.1 hypothetical protein CONCODRAFT_83148 [Conidiobolus coronatus NRRL 28638]
MISEKKSNLTDISVKSEIDNVGTGDVHQKGGSSFGAYFNVVCVIAGTGTLGLSHAIQQGGWISIIFFLITALIAVYTGKLLIECLYVNPDKRLEEFPDIGRAAFGTFGFYFVKIFHYSISLSASCLYILLTGRNCFLIASENGSDISQPVWTVIAGIVVLIPVICLKTLKEVAFIAAVGVLSTLVVIVVVLVGGIIDMPANLHQTHSVVNGSGFPLALATIAFSYGGNVVYPHVEATMQNPKNWTKVLMFAMLTITVMYFLVAISGYYVYGDSTVSPILENLPQGAIRLTGLVSITLHVIMAAPIYVCSFSLEQENILKIDTKHMGPKKEFFCRAVLRTFIVAILTVIAIYIPFFSDLMSLVGAVANCMTIFIIPTVCHYKLFGFKNRPKWEYVWTLIVIGLGLFGLIMGTVESVKLLIADFQGQNDPTVVHGH